MPEKILVVDDEQDIANLLEVYLQNENYTVYKYYCAKDIYKQCNFHFANKLPVNLLYPSHHL